LSTKERLKIAFKGLSDGVHEFDYSIEDSFFQALEYSEFKKGNAEVHIDLVKRPQYLEFAINIEGEVEVTCDRCLDEFYMPFDFDGNLYVKFSEEAEEIENIDELIVISPADSEVDLTHYVYESISLSLPYQRIHPEDEKGKSTCNKEMLKRFKTLEAKEEKKDIDPRWNKLKDINNN
jgi:uncharacterized metal-binding protein YceD (DUF177 family)